jgi:hypothetical protein
MGFDRHLAGVVIWEKESIIIESPYNKGGLPFKSSPPYSSITEICEGCHTLKVWHPYKKF